jgi:DNA-directed RNA polymerase subunit RPC12/RpoP
VTGEFECLECKKRFPHTDDERGRYGICTECRRRFGTSIEKRVDPTLRILNSATRGGFRRVVETPSETRARYELRDKERDERYKKREEERMAVQAARAKAGHGPRHGRKPWDVSQQSSVTAKPVIVTRKKRKD